MTPAQWKEVWAAFNRWCDPKERAGSLPDWDEQRRKIQNLVNAAIAAKAPARRPTRA